MSISSLLVRGLKSGRWMWNDITNELKFDSLIKEKKKKRQRKRNCCAAINGLTYAALKVQLKFKATVKEQESLNFKHFLKEINRERTDTIVTIQDCKRVAIFLCIQQLPNLFHKFYDRQRVNQLLRACIVYIQFYLQACESIVKNQHYLRGNPLPPGKTASWQAIKEDLDDLRVLTGRFYAGIILAEFGSSEISRTDEIMLFECFLRVSTIVVWIALERKYFNVIKVELERIFRTGYFNNFNAYDVGNILHQIKKENHVVLNGIIADIDKKNTKVPSRLTSNSPVIHNFLLVKEPKLIMIGREDFEGLQDDRLKFLTKFIFLPETEIQQEGVSLGILGLHRRLFDSLLYPCSKRLLKLLVTGSPLDISEDRKRLRENAIMKTKREHEPQSPHIFDELPRIPRPNQFTVEKVESATEVEEVLGEGTEFFEEDEEEVYEEEEEREKEEDLEDKA